MNYKKSHIIFILSILITIAVTVPITAAQSTMYATRYKLRQYNSVDDAASSENTTSTTVQECGMYARYSTHDAEILCVFDLSGIPSGATINNVDYGYNVSATSVGVDNVEIFVCDRAWTAPVTYDDLGDGADGAWATSIASQTCSAIGWNGWDDNATLKSLIEDSLATSDEIQIVLTNNPGASQYNIDVTRARLVIDYSNTAPTGGNDTRVTIENVDLTFHADSFSYNDVDSDPFSGIKIKTVETAGDLEYNGVDVSANDVIGTIGNLVFKPATDANGIGYASFTHWVYDGTDYSTSSYTMTIDVTNANGTPTDIALTSTSVNENQASGATVGTLSSTDPDAGDSHTYTLVSGSGDTDNIKFQINSTTLQTNAVFFYEDQQSFSIRIRTTDNGTGNLTYEEAFTITLNNIIMGTGSDIDLSFTAGWELGGKNADAEQLSTSKYLDGHLDEIRISSSMRSAQWIKLCYETQRIDQSCVTFATDDQLQLLPLTIKHDIGTDQNDTCEISTSSWKIIFDEDNGAGIKWLSDESSRGSNQLNTNLFYIRTDNINSYAVSGVLTLIEANTLFCKLRQTVSINSHEWNIEYTIYGNGRVYIHPVTDARTALYAPANGLEFRIESNVTNKSYTNESGTANTSDYILHSNTDAGKFDILMAFYEDWSQASAFSATSSTYYGILDNNWQLAKEDMQLWNFMIDFGHKNWNDTSGVGKFVDDYCAPDSLVFVNGLGTIRMEKDWESGLVAHWKFDLGSGSVVNDSSRSANTHNGTITNAVWDNTDFIWGGNSLDFENSDGNDYITVSTNLTDFNTGVFTIMMWIKPETELNSSSVLFGKYTASTGFKLEGDESDKIALTLDGATISGLSGPTIGSWKHIAASYHFHSGRIKLYIDGDVVRSIITQYPLTENNANIVIGNGYDGRMDDVRFYNQELSEETIKAIVENGYRINEGQYMVRADNNGTIHLKTDGTFCKPITNPIYQISNYWATSKPTAVYYKDKWLTENTDYYAKLNDASNILYIGFNKTVSTSNLRIYIDDNDKSGAYMVDSMPSLSYGTIGSDCYVKNFPGTTFGVNGSNEFYLMWKMNNTSPNMDGELKELKSSEISPGKQISSAENCISSSDLKGTIGSHCHYNSTYVYSQSNSTTSPPTYTVLETSPTRVRFKLDKRRISGTSLDYDITMVWTIYPTGQIFRYDSISYMSGNFDLTGMVFRQRHEGDVTSYISEIDYRAGVFGGDSTHDIATSYLSARDVNGVKQFFTGHPDTIHSNTSIEYDYTGLYYAGSDDHNTNEVPLVYSFYIDIQHQNMNGSYVDSVSEAVQNIKPLTMETNGGTLLTTTEGDINQDGFNEAEGAYIIRADNNSANFEIQADYATDGCRFNPAFRFTNYSSSNLPRFVRLYNGSDTTMMIEGYGYNGYVNTTTHELIIQLDTVLCTDTKIYLSCDDDLAVTMSEFRAEGGDGNNTLFWRTESESENLGFYLYRRIDPVFLDSLSNSTDSTTQDSLLDDIAGLHQKRIITHTDTLWNKVNKSIIPSAKGGTSHGPRDYKFIDNDVINFIKYEYKILSIDYNNSRSSYGPIAVTPHPIFPGVFFLFNNYPNPVKRYTNIRFDLPSKIKVSLNVYDLKGRLITSIIKPHRKLIAGYYNIRWHCNDESGKKLASGPYIYRLVAGKKYAKSRLMLLLK